MFNVNIIHHARIRQSLHIQLPSVQVGYFSWPNPDVTSGRNSQFSEASFALNPSWQHKKVPIGDFSFGHIFFVEVQSSRNLQPKNFNRTSRICVAEFTSYSWLMPQTKAASDMWQKCTDIWMTWVGPLKKTLRFGGFSVGSLVAENDDILKLSPSTACDLPWCCELCCCFFQTW